MSEGIKPEVKRAFDDILAADPFNVDLTKVQPSTSLAKMSGTLRSNQATTELTRRIVEVFGSKTGLDDLFDNFRDGSDPSEIEIKHAAKITRINMKDAGARACKV